MIDEEYVRCGELTDYHLQQNCAERGMDREWELRYNRVARDFDEQVARDAEVARTRMSGTMPEMHSIDVPSLNTPVMVNGKIMPMWRSAQMGMGRGGHGGGHHHGGGGWGGGWGWGGPGWYDPWGPDVVALPTPCPIGQMSVYNPQINQLQCAPIPVMSPDSGDEGMSGLGALDAQSLMVPAAVGAVVYLLTKKPVFGVLAGAAAYYFRK